MGKQSKAKKRQLRCSDPDNPPCWCGIKNPLYSEVHGNCRGMGVIDCICGGDQCVCHNHGEVECFGCADCDDQDDDYDGEWDGP